MNAQDKNGSYGLVIEPDAITRVNTMLTHLSHSGTFTGSVLIALDGRILLSHGYGFADRAQGIPNTPRTRFHLGSMTKMFTAMGILIVRHPQDHLTEIVLTNQGKIDHFSIWAAISNQLFREE